MLNVMEDLLTIVEHAVTSGTLPEGISEANAEYIAGIIRAGMQAERQAERRAAGQAAGEAEAIEG